MERMADLGRSFGGRSAADLGGSLIKEATPAIKKFLTENEDNLKYLSILSWVLLFIRCVVLALATVEFYYRDEGLKNAKNQGDVEREYKRWILKFGNIGILDLVSGLIFSVAFTLISKLLTPKFMSGALVD